MSETTEENFFEEALKKISRGDISDYDAFLHTIEKKLRWMTPTYYHIGTA